MKSSPLRPIRDNGSFDQDSGRFDPSSVDTPLVDQFSPSNDTADLGRDDVGTVGFIGNVAAHSEANGPAAQISTNTNQQSGAANTDATLSGGKTIIGGGSQSGFTINVVYDTSVNSAPAAFKTVVASVVQYFENQFTDPISLTIEVGYGEVAGQTMGSGALGQSQYFLDAYTYSQLKGALVADATTAADTSAIATLPTNDPTNGGIYWLTQANAKAVGLLSASGADGYVGFSSTTNWDYNNSDGVTAGAYDLFGTVAHEISEVMGRVLMVGKNVSGTTAYTPLDLFHYSSSGVRDFVGTQAGYFSIDGGATNLNNFNTGGGDPGDWAGSPVDAFNANGSSGVVMPVSAADLTELDAIGWDATQSGTAPQVSSVTATAGDYNAGKALILTLNMSAAVTVTGTPTLTLNDGGTATYTGGTGTSALTFSYTVTAGQNTAGLAVTALTGTIADLSGHSLSTSNLPETFTGVIIDTTTPTVSSVATSGTGITAGAGDLAAGSVVTLTLNMSEAVNVTGTPTLTLNDGGTATYTAGTGSNALTFSYTVGAGQNTSDLTVTAVTGTIADLAGNSANLAGAVTNPAGTLQIDTTAPTVSSVVTSGTGITAGAGDLAAGSVVTLTLNMSEAVNVTGTPTLTLNDGGTATYAAGTGSNALTFSYMVGTGQNTSDLTVTAVTGTVADLAGNAANLTGAVTNPAGTLQIDTTAPTVASVATSGTGIAAGAGDLAAGAVVTLTLNMSEVVNVTGVPTLTLNDGGTATYTAGTGTNALTFSYTVGAGQNTPDLTVTAVTGTIADLAGNAANLTGAVTNPAGTLQIDTTAPTVSSVVTSGTGITAGAGDLAAGSVLTLTLNMSEAVNVTGTPTLTLNDGGTATYTAGTGTNALTFSYTAGAGQNTPDLTVTAVTGTIADLAGNAANLTGAVTNPAGTLQIDTTAPTVSSVVTSGTGITAGAGDLAAGSVVTLTLNMSEAVNVTGVPTLTLNDGGTASYTGGTGTNALTFSYTVGAGQNTPDLTVTAVTGTIADLAGNAANLTGAVTNPAGTLQIDTTAPTVSSVVTSGTGITAGAGDLAAGSVLTLTLNMSEAVNVTGTPTLTLNDGGTATYTAGTGTNALTFSYTVGAGQNTPDLTVTAVTGTIANLAGNAANLTGAVTNPAGTLQIDTTAPTVSSVVTSGTGITAGAGDLAAGSVVALTLNMSEAVTVAGGVPTLTLNDGGTAIYTGGSGSSALTFSYTVAAGQNTSDLTVTAVNLGTATVKDGAGNAATLTGAVTNPAGTLQIDTTAPTVASVVTSGTGITAGAGDLAAGSVVTLTLNTSEAVNVTGTPTLTLNNGGTASYAGGTGTNALTFSYTVAAGQNTSDLTVTAVTGTITDLAGNAANLTGAVTNPGGTLQIDTTAPTVASAMTSGTGITAGAGDLAAGSVVTLTLNLSEAVTVAGGVPTLTLNDGGTAIYTGGSGSTALTFNYTVAAGQNTPDLTVTAVNLNAATVKDAAGNAANLTAAVSNPAGTLQIDTTVPTVSQVIASPPLGIENPGMPITLTLNMSEAVTVTGTPTLSLNDGGTATYASGSGTNSLTFSYTVGTSDSTVSALATTRVNLPSGATVTDEAGNAANLSGALTTLIGLQIDPPAQSLSVVVTSLSVAHGQSLPAWTLFAAAMPAGDTVTRYAFWDTGTGGSHFVVNGVAQGSNQEIDVAAAQLTQVTYQSGSGADMLWVRAYDGTQWSPWSNSFTVTAPVDTGPVLTPTSANVSAMHGQSFAASSLFTNVDPFGDAATQYDFWDTGIGGGHFVLNNQVLGANQEDFLSAVQLGQLTYQSGSGTDTLWVRTSDGTEWSPWSHSFAVTGPVDTGPVVAPASASVSATHGQSFAASSLFTYVDPFGDAATQYDFWDAGRGGGHFVLNGSALGANQENILSAAQLAQLTYQSGSGTDTVWVRANDGTQWSPWSNAFTVTGPVDTGPVVVPASASVSATHGQSFAASSLFTYVDPFGDAATQYDFWDSGSGGGHFVLNGSALGANQDNIVSAAQLAQLTYQSGSGTETVWVRANDGTQWSPWSNAFTVTGPVDTGPVVAPASASVSATHGQSFAASSLFTYVDPFGDAATQYDFWGSGSGGGHFVLNGSALGANQENIVSAAQLAQLTYQSGSGTDTVWVRANDGTQWSPWSNSFTVTGPVDTGPVVASVSNVLTVSGQSFAASSLFTAGDPFGDAATQYDFWDSGSGGGHFGLNGSALGANQENLVSATQLTQLTYQSGSGTDTLWVRVSEGGQWSAWSKSFTVSDSPTVGSGATLELASAYSGTLSFAAATGTLKIDSSSSFSGKIAGQLAIGDVIDLADVTAGANATIGYSGNNSPGTLTVSDGTHTASIALLGNYSLANFTASSDGHGGTSVIDPPLAGGNALYSAKDPADSRGGLNQQMAQLGQSMASFAPSDWGGSGTPKDGLLAYEPGQLSNLAQPVANQQHM